MHSKLQRRLPWHGRHSGLFLVLALLFCHVFAVGIAKADTRVGFEKAIYRFAVESTRQARIVITRMNARRPIQSAFLGRDIGRTDPNLQLLDTSTLPLVAAESNDITQVYEGLLDGPLTYRVEIVTALDANDVGNAVEPCNAGPSIGFQLFADSRVTFFEADSDGDTRPDSADTIIYGDALCDADDRDGDGLTDQLETAQQLDPTNPADGWSDLDSDGAVELVEVLAGTDPFNTNEFPTPRDVFAIALMDGQQPLTADDARACAIVVPLVIPGALGPVGSVAESLTVTPDSRRDLLLQGTCVTHVPGDSGVFASHRVLGTLPNNFVLLRATDFPGFGGVDLALTIESVTPIYGATPCVNCPLLAGQPAEIALTVTNRGSTYQRAMSAAQLTLAAIGDVSIATGECESLITNQRIRCAVPTLSVNQSQQLQVRATAASAGTFGFAAYVVSTSTIFNDPTQQDLCESNDALTPIAGDDAVTCPNATDVRIPGGGDPNTSNNLVVTGNNAYQFLADTDGDLIDDSVDADDDGDLLTDTQEVAAGLDPLDATDATDDNDGDGFDNRSEILAGTDIEDANDFPAAHAELDIDADGVVNALTDGLLVVRYLFDFRGQSLIANAVGDGAERAQAAAIEAHLASIIEALDVDDSTTVTALEDGLLVLRYLFGFRGNALIQDAVSDDALRRTADAIDQHIGAMVVP